METLDLVQGLSHILFVMHEKSQADTSDLVYVVSFLSQVSRPPKLSHNCLCQEPPRVCLVLIFWVFMVLSRGEKKLRLVKETQTRELNQRTAARISELRALSTGVATDIEERGTQCDDWSPYLNACLFCFLLVVVNLLFIQWCYTKGFLRFE